MDGKFEKRLHWSDLTNPFDINHIVIGWSWSRFQFNLCLWCHICANGIWATKIRRMCILCLTIHLTDGLKVGTMAFSCSLNLLMKDEFVPLSHLTPQIYMFVLKYKIISSSPIRMMNTFFFCCYLVMDTFCL